MSNHLVELLREFVAIDTSSMRSNMPFIAVLESKLHALGFSCERQLYVDASGIQKANLLATTGDGLPELALVGHTDCVPFESSWSDALTLTERDGRLYGRGACDTKAFIAAALVAAERTHVQYKKPLLLCFTADEEVGCVGAKKLLEAKKGRAKRAIIGEPTSLQAMRASKGYCLADIEVRGKEGHSAYPGMGASAIFRAARWLARLEAYANSTLRLELHRDFVPPYTTVNVGMIHGGNAKNIIPGSCRFTLEWRPLPSQPVNAVLNALESMRERLTEEDQSFEATLHIRRADRGFDTSSDADVVRFLVQVTGKDSGTIAFGTESLQFAALDAVPVVFGPGDITVAHQTGEYVPQDELMRAADVLETAVRHFCC